MVKTILVADDNSDNLELLSKILMEKNFKVLTADNGLEALDKIYLEKPDLILLDIMMPKVDGFHVLKLLKQNPDTKDIHVIMLSAKSETDSKVEGFQLGADDYVTKPFNVEELMARIDSKLRVQNLCGTSSKPDSVTKALERIEKMQVDASSRVSNIVAEDKLILEFNDSDDFNDFSLELKKFKNVNIRDVQIFEDKYIVTVGLRPLSMETIEGN